MDRIRSFHSDQSVLNAQKATIPESFEESYKMSIDFKNGGAEKFWAAQAAELSWMKPYERVLNNDNPPFTKWFDGGEINACYNCLDVHVENGRGDRVAMIYDSPVSEKHGGQTQRKITYKEMLHNVQLVANVLTEKFNVKVSQSVIFTLTFNF